MVNMEVNVYRVLLDVVIPLRSVVFLTSCDTERKKNDQLEFLTGEVELERGNFESREVRT